MFFIFRRFKFTRTTLITAATLSALLDAGLARASDEPAVEHGTLSGGLTGQVTGDIKNGVTGGSTGVSIQGNGLTWNNHTFAEGRAQAGAAFEVHNDDGLARTLTGQSLSGTLEAKARVGAMTSEEGFSFCPAATGEIKFSGALSVDQRNDLTRTGRTSLTLDPALCFMSDRGHDEILVRLAAGGGLQDNGDLDLDPESLRTVLNSSLLVSVKDARGELSMSYLPESGANRLSLVLDAQVADHLAVGLKGELEGLDLNPNGAAPRDSAVFTVGTMVSASF